MTGPPITPNRKATAKAGMEWTAANRHNYRNDDDDDGHRVRALANAHTRIRARSAALRVCEREREDERAGGKDDNGAAASECQRRVLSGANR